MRTIQHCVRAAGAPSFRYLPLVALFICGGLPGAAQVIPPGSYQNTCRSMSVVDGTLLAECQMADQSWRATTLANAAQCKGEIVNTNGKLECRERTTPRTTQYQEGYAAAGGKCDDRDGAEYLRLRIAGDPNNEIKIVFDKRFKTQIHIFHKQGTMVAWDCGKWPPESQFHYIDLN